MERLLITHKYLAIGSLVVLAACNQEEPPVLASIESGTVISNVAMNEVANAEPDSVADKMARARYAIAKEPKIRDFILEPGNAVMLQVAVDSDGSREYGYAEYLCLQLKDFGLYNDRAAVRVVDVAKLHISEENFRSISLGTVMCRDGTRLD